MYCIYVVYIYKTYIYIYIYIYTYMCITLPYHIEIARQYLTIFLQPSLSSIALCISLT